MNDSEMDDKEWVSALADGQLDPQDMARCLQSLAGNLEARDRWNTYHLIGDVLREPDLAAATPSAEFVRRLSLRLAQEPLPAAADAMREAADGTVAPQVITPAVRMAQVVQVLPVAQADRAGANDSRFTWRFKLAAGFASAATLGAVVWMALGAAQDPGLAQVPAPARLALESMPAPMGMVVTRTDKGPMLRDPVLDEMLATHRQTADMTALQAPAAGLHNATFESSGR